MMYNNPATSGVEMSRELLVRMFETIDIVSMVKESTGDLSSGAGCCSATAASAGVGRCRQAPRVGHGRAVSMTAVLRRPARRGMRR